MQKYAKKQSYFFTIVFLIVFVMNSNVSVPKQQLNTLHPDFNTLFLCLFVLYNFEIITKCMLFQIFVSLVNSSKVDEYSSHPLNLLFFTMEAVYLTVRYSTAKIASTPTNTLSNT